jgi:DNA repair protein RecN (Recombination protein N)
MLVALQIENFALVDRLELSLESGLTVLTGETGAGKSIILDAIDAVLGGKVTNRAIRAGADRALIEATFYSPDPSLANWIAAQELPPSHDGKVICSREITLSGSRSHSRSRINGVAVNKQQIEEIRDRLVEITAQGQSVQLERPALQRDWLDSYGGEPLLEQRQQVAQCYSQFQQAVKALEKRRKLEQERLQQLDLFSYQLQELTAAHLSDPDELEQLEQEAKRLSHSVELQQQSYLAYQALYQNDGDDRPAAADRLGEAEDILQSMVEYDHQIQPVLELVNAALAQVQQAAREISVYGEAIEADPQRLSEVQDRIAELKPLCRKYGPTLADAIALQHRLQADLQDLTDEGQSLDALEQAVQNTQTALTQACTRLTNLRQQAATDLEARLIAELKPLAMDKVQFRVQLTTCAPSGAGADQVTFLFSPNPGEPLQPLTEIASGGEMSRFLLAMQACFSEVDSVGTLVFDEIDVGVSGRVSQAIAEKLYQLSRHHQVLCVTHQPIVAAMADQHFRVNKQVVGTQPEITPTRKQRKPETLDVGMPPSAPEATESDVRTVVRITALDRQQRKAELAQLAGGELQSASDSAYAFAESLLEQAAALRKSGGLKPAS